MAQLALLARLERAEVRHLLVRGALDHVPVGLKLLEAQQAVVVGRLFLGRDAKPDVIGIEVFRHGMRSVIRALVSAKKQGAH